jgi:hypothetical protein
MEENPVLVGLNPLYTDFEPKCWWWQSVTFLVTLILCGPVLLLPGEASSLVFIQLVVSSSMMVALANQNPYMHKSDDLLAQLCQVALTFTMSVGLLEMASEEFQDEYFGAVLIVCTTMQFGIGFIVAAVHTVKEKMPGTVSALENLFSTPQLDESFMFSPRQIKRPLLEMTRNELIATVAVSRPKSTRLKSSRVQDDAGSSFIAKNKVAPLLDNDHANDDNLEEGNPKAQLTLKNAPDEETVSVDTTRGSPSSRLD